MRNMNVKCGTAMWNIHVECGTATSKSNVECGTATSKSNVECGTAINPSVSSRRLGQGWKRFAGRTSSPSSACPDPETRSSSKLESSQMAANSAGLISCFMLYRLRVFTMGIRVCRSPGTIITCSSKGDPPARHTGSVLTLILVITWSSKGDPSARHACNVFTVMLISRITVITNS
jgi:hypothetical protein